MAVKSRSAPPDGAYKRTINQNVRTVLFSQSVMGLEDWTHDGRFVIDMPDAKSIWACHKQGTANHSPLFSRRPW